MRVELGITEETIESMDKEKLITDTRKLMEDVINGYNLNIESVNVVGSDNVQVDIGLIIRRPPLFM